jgi:hypothetical protein
VVFKKLPEIYKKVNEFERYIKEQKGGGDKLHPDKQ